MEQYVKRGTLYVYLYTTIYMYCRNMQDFVGKSIGIHVGFCRISGNAVGILGKLGKSVNVCIGFLQEFGEQWGYTGFCVSIYRFLGNKGIVFLQKGFRCIGFQGGCFVWKFNIIRQKNFKSLLLHRIILNRHRIILNRIIITL